MKSNSVEDMIRWGYRELIKAAYKEGVLDRDSYTERLTTKQMDSLWPESHTYKIIKKLEENSD